MFRRIRSRLPRLVIASVVAGSVCFVVCKQWKDRFSSLPRVITNIPELVDDAERQKYNGELGNKFDIEIGVTSGGGGRVYPEGGRSLDPEVKIFVVSYHLMRLCSYA